MIGSGLAFGGFLVVLFALFQIFEVGAMTIEEIKAAAGRLAMSSHGNIASAGAALVAALLVVEAARVADSTPMYAVPNPNVWRPIWADLRNALAAFDKAIEGLKS
mgnify:CR=1 FL=1